MATIVRELTSLVPAPQPVDESPEGKELMERKRRRLETSKGLATEDEGSGVPQQVPRPVFMADAILSGRSAHQRSIAAGTSSVRAAEGGSMTNVNGVGRGVEESDSEIVQEDMDELVKGLTHVDMMTDGSDRRSVIPGAYNLLLNSEQAALDLTLLCAFPESETLRAVSVAELSRSVTGMALQVSLLSFACCKVGLMRADFCFSFQTLVLEVEWRRREQKKATIFDKMAKTYRRYRFKHRAAVDLFQQDPEFRVFYEGLE